MAARTFEDLIVWQKAYRFVLGLYRLTRHEIHGLTSQMRKAAVFARKLLESDSEEQAPLCGPLLSSLFSVAAGCCATPMPPNPQPRVINTDLTPIYGSAIADTQKEGSCIRAKASTVRRTRSLTA